MYHHIFEERIRLLKGATENQRETINKLEAELEENERLLTIIFNYIEIMREKDLEQVAFLPFIFFYI